MKKKLIVILSVALVAVIALGAILFWPKGNNGGNKLQHLFLKEIGDAYAILKSNKPQLSDFAIHRILNESVGNYYIR